VVSAGAGPLVPSTSYSARKADPAAMTRQRHWTKRHRHVFSLPWGRSGGVWSFQQVTVRSAGKGVAGFAFSGFGRGRFVAGFGLLLGRLRLSDRVFVSLGVGSDLVELVALDAASGAEGTWQVFVARFVVAGGCGTILGVCFLQRSTECVGFQASLVTPPPCPVDVSLAELAVRVYYQSVFLSGVTPRWRRMVLTRAWVWLSKCRRGCRRLRRGG